MNFDEQRQVLEYVSGYFRILLRRFPEYGRWLWENRQINRKFSLLELNSDLTGEIANTRAELGLVGEVSFRNLALSLRKFKQRHFLRIGSRDLFGLDDLQSTVQQVSDIAAVILQTCLKLFSMQPDLWLKPSELREWENLSRRIDLAVIGLGKLGGRELNYVSDIDIMFLFDIRDPKDRSEQRHLSLIAQKFLPRLCTQLIHLLEHNFDGDRVFKIDMRLRPAGKDGELVSPLSYATHHYLVEGQSWERLALLKATPVAGSLILGNLFVQEIRPFVFRRFLDFQSLEEIKSLRDKILQETPSQAPGPGFNVKLGIGGIREIEFIVQSLQLIYGGRNPDLRNPNTIQTLNTLAKSGLLDETTSFRLKEAYEFLRKTEHWIQLMNNQASQVIPKNKSSLARLALAVMYSNHLTSYPPSTRLFRDADRFVPLFFETLKKHTDFVHSRFVELFETSKKNTTSQVGTTTISSKPSPARVSTLKIEHPELKTSFATIMEQELAHIRDNELQRDIINRCERFSSAISRRPGLVTFFDKHSDIFELCVRGLIKSEFIADLLIHLPSLSEGIVRNVNEPWIGKVRAFLDNSESFEEKLHWLRRIKNERLISIAIDDVTNNPSGEVVEHLLSELADFTITETYRLICEERDVPWDEFPLVVCALGKLGSREFNYTSDLDLVFIYDPPPTENQEVIPEKVTKLIQRFVRLLSIPLSEGPGYEVDMRLRPTGNYGPLIVTRRTWKEYYEKNADIWELASLVRFRPICGHEKLSTELITSARKILNNRKNPEEVWARLCSLKKRVETERSKTHNTGKIDIKLGPGGIMDIELWCHGTLISWPKAIHAYSMSTRDLIKSVFSFWKIDNSALKNLMKAFYILKRLEQRVVLAGYDAKAFDVRQLEKMRCLGLLSAPELDDALDWADITMALSRIKKWWDRVCQYRKPST